MNDPIGKNVAVVRFSISSPQGGVSRLVAVPENKAGNVVRALMATAGVYYVSATSKRSYLSVFKQGRTEAVGVIPDFYFYGHRAT